MALPLAAERGFSVADPYAIGLLFLGLAVFAAVGALSHQHERAFSASVVYLGLGLLAALAIELLDVQWVDPLDDTKVIERASELAVIVALFATGLKLDRELSAAGWKHVARLLAVAMPLTIAAVALFGAAVIGLSVGGAIVLGAALAPTDPVLAGDLGVGPPGEEEEREPNFAITGEAGLNDGLAFPFVFLGLFVASEPGSGWLVDWLAADVLYAVLVGVAIGAAVGYGIAAAAVWLRDRDLLSHDLDGWLAIAAVLVIYGLTEAAGAYGFLAAFAGGVAFRRYERDHEYNRRVHEGAEIVEKFSELALILLLGSVVTIGALDEPGLGGWLLVPVLLLLVRPAAVMAALAGTGMARAERSFLAWFGVRGIGSLYYAAVAVGTGVLTPDEASTVFWATAACVIASVLIHGMTADPLARRWLSRAHAEAR